MAASVTRHNHPGTVEIPSPRVSLLKLEHAMIIEWRGDILRVPAGYTCNAASVPPLLWIIVPPTGLILYGSIPHDYGYERTGRMWTLHRDPDGVCHWLRKYYTKSQIDALLRDIHRADAAEWIKQHRPCWPVRNWLRLQPWLAWVGVTLFGWPVWMRYKRRNQAKRQNIGRC